MYYPGDEVRLLRARDRKRHGCIVRVCDVAYQRDTTYPVAEAIITDDWSIPVEHVRLHKRVCPEPAWIGAVDRAALEGSQPQAGRLMYRADTGPASVLAYLGGEAYVVAWHSQAHARVADSVTVIYWGTTDSWNTREF